MLRLTLLSLLLLPAAWAQSPVHVLLWFDTEDFVEPASDDAALRIATLLEKAGVRGTFKVVGEKARVLEQRGRTDVIEALKRHSIGYHTDGHSLPPAPAVYLRSLGFLEGAQEFARRESAGVADLTRIFERIPSSYGQPGSSWAPQAYPALLRLGIRSYVDEGSQVGLDQQPFYYGGLLHVFAMGANLIRPDLNHPERNPEILDRFDAQVRKLAASGGGVISTYYHPTEFVTTEFWDAVNFSEGAARNRAEWRKPHRRSAGESERCYRILADFVEHAKRIPAVDFITADDLPRLYPEDASLPLLDRSLAARHFSTSGITFLETGGSVYSAGEVLSVLLGLAPRFVEGPVARAGTTYASTMVPRWLWDRAVADVKNAIERNGRLPDSVYLASDTLSIADFAATLAGDPQQDGEVTIRKGTLAFEKYFSNDPVASFRWIIHPRGFAAPELLELARLQGWTLKPARLARATAAQKRPRASELGIRIGRYPAGRWNAITDVAGVRVGHATVIRGAEVRTGVTAILPHGGNLFQQKVPAAVFVGNGFGKLMGSTQIRELGEIETPILLTSTLNVPRVADALLDYMLGLAGNERVRSINPVVAETNDGTLNDIRSRPVGALEVRQALNGASSGPVEEGSVGAGTGTIAFGFKGGIGTASRRVPLEGGEFTVGVLVQTNYGGDLRMGGVAVGQELHSTARDSGRGSVIVVIATDAPLSSRNLERLAARAMLGLGRTGASGSNGSGDYSLAFSTVRGAPEVANDAISPLFEAAIDATEEAVDNSLLQATTVSSKGVTVEAISIEKLKQILVRHGIQAP